MSAVWKHSVPVSEFVIDTTQDTANANGSTSMDGTNKVVSPNLSTDIMGTVATIGINILTGGSSATATVTVETSIDGTNWITAATPLAAVAAQTVAVSQAICDLRAVIAPYARLAFNGGGASVGTSGRFKFMIGAMQHFKERSI